MKVEINIPNEDAQRLAEIAAESGFTVAQLLESFAGDLVGGRHSNGSDERELAREWYDRAGYAYTAPDTFLRYLISGYALEDFLEALNFWEDGAADLECLESEKEPTPADLTDIAEIKREMEETAQEMRGYFDRYAATTDTPETWETALEAVKAYRAQFDSM